MNPFMKTKKIYLLGIKREDTFILSSKPLFVVDSGDKISLSYMRDIDMMIGIRDGEKIEMSIIGMEKGRIKRDMKENEIHGEEIKWKIQEKIEIKNKRKTLEMERGDVDIEKNHIKMHWSSFKMEEKKGRDYYITTPSILVPRKEFEEWEK